MTEIERKIFSKKIKFLKKKKPTTAPLIRQGFEYTSPAPWEWEFVGIKVGLPLKEYRASMDYKTEWEYLIDVEEAPHSQIRER
jgi:hypothetical protein